MTATNMCSNFVGFRCRVPLIQDNLSKSTFSSDAIQINDIIFPIICLVLGYANFNVQEYATFTKEFMRSINHYKFNHIISKKN